MRSQVSLAGNDVVAVAELRLCWVVCFYGAAGFGRFRRAGVPGRGGVGEGLVGLDIAQPHQPCVVGAAQATESGPALTARRVAVGFVADGHPDWLVGLDIAVGSPPAVVHRTQTANFGCRVTAIDGAGRGCPVRPGWQVCLDVAMPEPARVVQRAQAAGRDVTVAAGHVAGVRCRGHGCDFDTMRWPAPGCGATAVSSSTVPPTAAEAKLGARPVRWRCAGSGRSARTSPWTSSREWCTVVMPRTSGRRGRSRTLHGGRLETTFVSLLSPGAAPKDISAHPYHSMVLYRPVVCQAVGLGGLARLRGHPAQRCV